jgi:hypothetical protein
MKITPFALGICCTNIIPNLYDSCVYPAAAGCGSDVGEFISRDCLFQVM